MAGPVRRRHAFPTVRRSRFDRLHRSAFLRRPPWTPRRPPPGRLARCPLRPGDNDHGERENNNGAYPSLGGSGSRVCILVGEVLLRQPQINRSSFCDRTGSRGRTGYSPEGHDRRDLPRGHNQVAGIHRAVSGSRWPRAFWRLETSDATPKRHRQPGRLIIALPKLPRQIANCS